MKAGKFIEELNRGSFEPPVTCDTVKAGDPNSEVRRIAFSMFATAEVIRAAKAWGADMLVVHEPTYFDHMDVMGGDPVTRAKKSLVDDSGLVIYRYHDHMHFRAVDQVTDGELHYLGLSGQITRTEYGGSYILRLDTPITASELAERARCFLGVRHPRIAGERDKPATTVAACFGQPGGVFELIKNESVELVVAGEVCEWQVAEYARDAAALGFNKSLVVLGHAGSEKDSMKYLCENLQKEYPDLTLRYFDCGEVYTYID